MKKIKIILLTLFLITFCHVAKSQIENLTNQSAEWVRSGSRNASMDAADIMAYNPAGMAMMKPGWHIGLGNQMFFRKPSHEYTMDFGAGPTVMKYQQKGNDLFVPNINIGFTKNNLSFFGGANIIGGGGAANYPQGTINTDLLMGQFIPQFDAATGADYTYANNVSLKGSVFHLAIGGGAAYSFNDKISAGMMIRNVMAKSTTEAGFALSGSAMGLPDQPFALSTSDHASGLGAVISIFMKPVQKMNFSLRYESKVSLNYKKSVEKDDAGMFTDGATFQRDLPAVAGSGISYAITEKFKMAADFNYYFQTQADWGTTDPQLSELYGTQKLSALAGNAYNYSLSMEYAFSNSFLISAGGVKSVMNYKDRPGYYTHLGAFEMAAENNFTLCYGMAYTIREKTRINLGMLHAFYQEQSVKSVYYMGAGADVDVNVKNSATGIGIGVDFMF